MKFPFLLMSLAAASSLWAAAPSTTLHYRPTLTPDGPAAVCIDGSRKFIRGLYGAHSGFRVDCSDIPEFGIYLPRMGGNMLFTLPEGQCFATYVPGRMDYSQGGVQLSVQVLRSSDAAIWKLTNNTSRKVTVPFRFGGVADKKFSREGDLGVDKPDCFDLKPEYCKGNIYKVSKNGKVTVEYGNKERKILTLDIPFSSYKLTGLPSLEGKIVLKPGETRYVTLIPQGSKALSIPPAELYSLAEGERAQLASQFSISTPDEWINPIAPALSVAADGIWSGEAWLHGSIGWRTPHLGWRGAYTGDALGLHDRALTHFRTYAANQITDIPPRFEHPRQDSALNLARAEKLWGTPMYSNGYICRRPGKKDEMSHYDMNLVYADALLRHLRATGDTAAMRELFPTLKLHLEWEKRNFDPDGDHLYDAYCCIWASDALYYSGGQVTHSSAYNMLANKIAADVAEAIGEDPTPYREEAAAIGRAIDSVLWMPARGHWAEFKEYGDNGRLHPSAALWTIYHAIDSEVGDMFRNYAATAYVDREIPHIPVTFTDPNVRIYPDSLYTLSTTNWKPYSWSINNVAIAEVMHTALAYWQAQRPDEAFKILKGTVMDNMYLGASPLNFGQISQFDAARGECYRDFADPIGVWSRAIVEGLYGIRPNLIGRNPGIDIMPGFPSEWNEASVTLPDISYSFARTPESDTYTIDARYPRGSVIRLTVPASGLNSILVNGKSAAFATANAIGEPKITVTIPGNGKSVVNIGRTTRTDAIPTGEIRREGGVTFHEYAQGPLRYWAPVHESLPSLIPALPEDFTEVDSAKCETVAIDEHFNASLPEIFKQQYLSPRPPVTTLQLPTQGMGEWCHPKLVEEIDNSGLRTLAARDGGKFVTSIGVPFATPADGRNIIFTSLWDNWPDSVTVPLTGQASHLYLMMAGSTNHMQWGMENATLTAHYTDGSSETLPLVNPVNWAPVEQDFFTNKYAYSQPGGAKNPYRLNLRDGRVSRTLLEDIHGEEVPIDKGMELGVTNGRNIPGGAAVLVDFPVDPAKSLSSLTLATRSRDVVVGIMSITKQRP